MEAVKLKYNTYPSYKDSGVDWLGEIPEHWDAKRLGTHFKERRTKVSDKDYKPLSVTKQGILPQLENAAKSNDGDNRKLVKEGDFVINSRSDRKGSSGISNEDGSVSLINIVMKPKNFKHAYTNYLLKGYSFIEEFYRNGHGIVADLWTTRYDEMKNIKIPIPPIEEQTAIANFLDKKTAKIDKVIAQKEKLIELLKERKQILIQNTVTGKIVWNEKEKVWTEPAEVKDSGVEWIGEIPMGWQVKRLRFLGYTQNGISAGADYFGSGYPFVSYSDVYKNIELPTKVGSLAASSIEDRKNYSVKENDVFFTRTSETMDEVGFSSVCFKTIENATFAGFLIRFRPTTEKLYKGFSKYYFSCKIHRGYFTKEMNLVTRASLSQELLKDLPVLIPSFEEQKEISRYLETQSTKIDKAIALQQTQIEKLKEYKATLIDSAVTGKIKVS